MRSRYDKARAAFRERMETPVQCRRFFIYVLYNRQGRIVYVGRSEIPAFRVYQHSGRFPEAVGYSLVEEVIGLDLAKAAETKWIQAFIATGQPLRNRRQTGHYAVQRNGPGSNRR